MKFSTIYISILESDCEIGINGKSEIFVLSTFDTTMAVACKSDLLNWCVMIRWHYVHLHMTFIVQHSTINIVCCTKNEMTGLKYTDLITLAWSIHRYAYYDIVEICGDMIQWYGMWYVWRTSSANMLHWLWGVVLRLWCLRLTIYQYDYIYICITYSSIHDGFVVNVSFIIQNWQDYCVTYLSRGMMPYVLIYCCLIHGLCIKYCWFREIIMSTIHYWKDVLKQVEYKISMERY